VNVATLGSDDRLQQAVDSVAEESTRHWQRIMVTIIVGLLVVASLAGVAIKFSGSAKDAAEKAEAAAVDSAKVSSYVEHCLVHPDKATPGECGNTAATGQQSATILALFCYLQLPEPQRTDATAQECFTKAATLARAQAAAATTTTTTR
jgi:hypothetical protein